MEGDENLKHCSVGVGWNAYLLRLSISRVLDGKPQAIIQREASRDGENEISGVVETRCGGGVIAAVVVEVEGDVHVVNAGVGGINKVSEVDGESGGTSKDGGVPRDVLAHSPYDTIKARLGSAATEKLDAGEPNAKDAIELTAARGGGPLEDDLGRRVLGTVGGEGVRSGDRGLSVGEGEVVLEKKSGAGSGIGDGDGLRDFEEGGRGDGGGFDHGVFEDSVDRSVEVGGGDGDEEEEEEKEERRRRRHCRHRRETTEVWLWLCGNTLVGRRGIVEIIKKI